MATRSGWQDVHLFVSSTFRDTQAERDVLVRRVFPVLRAELIRHKVRLIDIDLRWGIEGQDESGVVAVCMEVLEQALPRFIGIIGDRYGWMPPGSAVSVTEQEITTALGYENCHPLFLFRDPARPDGSASLDFLDDSDSGENALQKAKKLSLLRTRIEERGTARVRSYQCSIHQGKVVPDAAFASQALDGLRESLRSLYATDDAPTEPTPSDTVGHALNFASERAAEWLEGLREDALTRITDFLTSETGHLHILGEGGSGKTSLLAKTLDEILDESINDGRAVLAAFCGAHRGAESGEAVLRGFADRLVDTSIPASDDHDPSRPPSDFDGLRTWFARRITDTKAILLIDGIDQLPERDRFLTWLPNPVPDGVTVLTGSLDTASTNSLSEHWKARATDVITLPPLDNLAGAGFVKSQLTRYRKTLSEAALSSLLAKPGASTPLYLRIVAEELRTKGVRENLESDISGMPGTAGGMFLWVLERLANDQQFRWSDGHRAVASLAGCLGIARDGLSEAELVALLSAIDPDGHDPDGDTAVLLQLLRPYLGRRGDRYAPLHRVFAEALHGVGITDADRSLLGSEHPAPLDELSEVQRAHAQLASLFAEMPADNFRRLSEEAWHRIHSGDLGGACGLLTDFAVLKARVDAGLVRGILDDMDALVRSASGADWSIPEELRVWQRLFRRRREFWEQFPEEFHQDCLNEAEGLPTTESAKAYPIDKPWIRWVNKPEHEIRHGWEWMVRDASCAAFSPDGKTVAVGGTDGSLRLIDADAGLNVYRVKGHTRVITVASFSTDGSTLLTASRDKTARVWDASTGLTLLVLSGHEGGVRSAIFSPDGARVLTASYDKTARIWDASSGVELNVLRGHEHWLNNAVFSPDGNRVLTASDDETARLWDASTGVEVNVLCGHEGSIHNAVFSPDGTRVLTASYDMTARLWDASTGAELLMLGGHKRSVNTAIFSPDGSRLLTASWDQTARVWDASSGSELLVLKGNEGAVESPTFSPSGAKLLTASWDQTARVWDASTGTELLILRGHEDRVLSATFSPNGAKVLTASWDNTVRIWDASSGAELFEPKGHEREVTSATYSPDGSMLLTASKDKTARIWDTSSYAELFVLKGHTRSVHSANFSPDGSKVLTVSHDDTGRIWDASSGGELLVLGGYGLDVKFAVFSPDSTKVLTVSIDNTGRVWNASNGIELSVLGGLTQDVNFATFCPDGSKVLTSSKKDTGRVWDTSSGGEISVLGSFTNRVTAAMFNADGSKVVTCTGNYDIQIWDTLSGTELVNIPPPIGYVEDFVSHGDIFEVVSSHGEKLYWWEDGSKVLDSDYLMKCFTCQTLLGKSGDVGLSLRIRGRSKFRAPFIHLDAVLFGGHSRINPTDPLSFVAGCADGSVRFFHLEGVDLPTSH